MSKLPQRERVVIPERKEMTLAREVAILRRHVFCGGCGKHMTARSQYVYDHEFVLGICGRDDPEDMRPLCHECDDAKTPEDLKTLAKLKRLAGETCVGPTARPIPPGRPMDGTKASGLKRGFDGRVTRR